MDERLIISEFGCAEAAKLGVSSTHLPVGIDTNICRMPTKEERAALRNSFGFDKNTFAILTVADNQERKNLSAAVKIVSKFSEDKPNVKYMLVTRVHCPVGWKLDDLLFDNGIHQKTMKFERGMGFKELWALFAVSDCFLLTSKAEGLGMPLMEAMSVGLPCVATNCTGMEELLTDNRGFLVASEYSDYLDPFGNGRRYFIDKNDAVCKLEKVYAHSCQRMINKARKYVEGRTWDKSVAVVDTAIKEVMNT